MKKKNILMLAVLILVLIFTLSGCLNFRDESKSGKI